MSEHETVETDGVVEALDGALDDAIESNSPSEAEATAPELDLDEKAIEDVLEDEDDSEDLAGDVLDDDDEDEDDDLDDDDDDDAKVNYMQNRELSWLRFNERVLDQGADESVPLLQRLNFISIFWSNLQEFFMVRVGSLTDLSYIEPPVEDSKTGMTPKEQIRAIHERCSELYPIQESYYEHVRGSLAKEGVRHLRPEDISDEQRNYLFGLVRHNIEPFLSPQIINSRHPFPHLENGKLYILVRLDEEAAAAERKKKKKVKGKKKDKGKIPAEGVLFGLIPLPHQCERVIKLPGRGFQFILLEHAIEMFVPEIFNMYKIKHTNVICVTRNADIDANQGFDEQDEDYREHMKRLLKQRARLAPVRLECERPLSPVMERVMLNKLGLKRYQVYDTIVPLDLSFTWGLGSNLSEKKVAKLTDAPFTPAWPTCFDKSRRIMDQVTEGETLLFYPYESMDPFVQLLREAAVDPDVVSIKITLYRLASQSHLAEALIAAADAGKEVTALFELRARFDENNNIEWSQRFEEAGCNVIYGFRDYKVHSKICCITRRTADGIQHITQLGTGNYNEKTAKLYTDLSFITTSEDFGRDAVEFFRNMQLEHVSDNYKFLRVAPLQIKPLILENLDKQIQNAREGRPARAFMKANSVTDKDVIEKISEASNAGVRITLFVRGICCLVPRVKGATENVRVVSIVGRLLEHSRIYCFGEGDDSVVYLSSADLMTRNLNKRVEIAWPVLNRELRDKVLTYIDICMSDTAKLRELRPNATYTPLGAFCDIDDEGNSTPAFDAQDALIKQAAEAARIMSEMEAEAAERAEQEASAAVAAAAAAAAEVASDLNGDAGTDVAPETDGADLQAAAYKQPDFTQDEQDNADAPAQDATDDAEEPESPAEAAEIPAEAADLDESALTPVQGNAAEAAQDAVETVQDAAETVETPQVDAPASEPEIESDSASPDEIAYATAQEATEAAASVVDEPAIADAPADSADPEQKASTPDGSSNASVSSNDDETTDAETADAGGDAEAIDQAVADDALQAADSRDTTLTEAEEQAKAAEDVADGKAEAEEAQLPEASDRVAELIDQLGSIPEQKVDPALEPLTEMKVVDIIPPDSPDATVAEVQPTTGPEATGPQTIDETLEAARNASARLEELAAAAEAEAASAAAEVPSSQEPLQAASDTVAQNENVVVPDSVEQPAWKMAAQSVSDATKTETPTAAAEAQSAADADATKAPEGSGEGFFSEESRPIEMPAKKKKGFWSRWFG